MARRVTAAHHRNDQETPVISEYRQSDAEREPDGSGEDHAQDRARAARELGDALRELVQAAAGTEVDAATLRKTADQARDLVGPLTEASRTRHVPPTLDEAKPGRRMYNPASGPGNPIAPPMRVRVADGVATGTCTLGLAYEGPHSYTHGGISAMLVDQILGHAHAAQGRPGMTVSLSLRYRRPVPLETPLRLTAWVPEDSITDRRTGPKATITTEDEPDRVLVEASGIFVIPTAEQAERIFGDNPPPRWSEK
ncbi:MULTISPECIES: PaaI family thioesterase [unclassified Saccharopolyspora]|uniref:PaaI family thioesterase n=1 Tax=unclassified Saccharopolyspora TaxID=2646250 RepID=UPI001CD4D64A|nr:MULTISPECIES: PaaI family thioesterase [unclassified Saccharopolyspora]MCA1187166.1 PaaI family thioesterase [Saccharopolyspora sp. 6T]MCA1193726.1 PaaI family thioesterase [Saccharopolyspora sp. 6V]MCA1228072.1 PaaI family thioesterase [Saccharopolyspora sp. 6M]MCA1282459.1 PaaI family thioesterase [Saccharopolyspora sp. 7B]